MEIPDTEVDDACPQSGSTIGRAAQSGHGLLKEPAQVGGY
jgi:hypothetical protein